MSQVALLAFLPVDVKELGTDEDVGSQIVKKMVVSP